MESRPKDPDRSLLVGRVTNNLVESDARASFFFQALGDPTRLAVVRLLRAREQTVGELVLALAVPQPKVSRHLKVLRDAGLVVSTKEGRIVRCRLATSRSWPVEGREWIETLAAGVPLAEHAAPPLAAMVPAVSEASIASENASSRAKTSKDLETHLL